MKTQNHVNCPWCAQESPREKCSLCKGTGKVIDPAEQLCNMCGGRMCHSITTPTGRWEPDCPHGLYNTKVSGGYESYHLFDMTSYIFSFCEECLRKFFTQCKIPPKVTEYGIDFNPDGSLGAVDRETQSWEEDQKCYQYRIWKDNGGYHQAYLNRKCNAIKDCPNEAVYTHAS